jgi:hypothetical protein
MESSVYPEVPRLSRVFGPVINCLKTLHCGGVNLP